MMEIFAVLIYYEFIIDNCKTVFDFNGGVRVI
jgi:hypothetical protein